MQVLSEASLALHCYDGVKISSRVGVDGWKSCMDGDVEPTAWVAVACGAAPCGGVEGGHQLWHVGGDAWAWLPL